MYRVLGSFALMSVLATLPGCGAGNTNALPPEAGSAEYAKASGDKMKQMYGIAKPQQGKVTTASDRMKAMYGH